MYDEKYNELSGPELAGYGAIGSTYQSASQEVSGSGAPVYGIGASYAWNEQDHGEYIGALYFDTIPCNGATEYGFAHYFSYYPAVDQFHFYQYSNCPDAPGSEVCYTTATSGVVADQCQAAVNIPTLEQNSRNGWLYDWYVYVSVNPSNGHHVFNAGVYDPYSGASVWSCTADPLSTTGTFSNCPNIGYTNYTCASGEPSYAYPTASLYPGTGSVTVGISNVGNQAPSGTNPMLTMQALYILETAP